MYDYHADDDYLEDHLILDVGELFLDGEAFLGVSWSCDVRRLVEHTQVEVL